MTDEVQESSHSEPEVPQLDVPDVPSSGTETADVEMPGTLAAGLTIGGGAPADESVASDYRPVIRGKIDRFGAAMGTGRRKTSVARVRIKDGTGQFSINGRELSDYFPTERDHQMVQAPLKATQTLGKVDVWVRVNGGGTTGQTGAIMLGIARALQARDAGLHHHLAEGGYLTRDGRMVERKKYGFKKARKSFQFSKR
jgi:small subunit ribosomal protein S9